MTQKQLGEMLGFLGRTSDVRIAHYESESRTPTSDLVKEMAQIFDVSPCFLQALFPQKCRLNSSKLHGEFPHYCISSAGTLSGAGEEPLQAYKVY